MSLNPTPFKVHFPEVALEALKAHLKASPIAKPTFEASDASGARFGVKRAWLNKAKARWENGYDWRAQEARINKFAQFTAPVMIPDGSILKLHFVHERASKANARTILLLHGWPGSYLEFLEVIKILKSSGDYNIVAPSHPGYAFSDPPPTDKEFGKADVAEYMDALMQGLGYKTYAVQAGDWGAAIARILAVKFDSVKCAHLNFIPMTSPPAQLEGKFTLSAEDEAGLARGKEFVANGTVALLSWVGEKFLEWTDDDPPIDEVLTNLTLWWLTDTFPSSIYIYRDTNANATDPRWHIEKPTAFSSFAKELVPSPRAWAATSVNLTWYRYHANGGHFAAMERPEALARDIREFLAQEWPLEARL